MSWSQSLTSEVNNNSVGFISILIPLPVSYPYDFPPVKTSQFDIAASKSTSISLVDFNPPASNLLSFISISDADWNDMLFLLIKISSIDTEGARIRIRDREDVICEQVEDIDDDNDSNEVKPDEDTDVDTDEDEDSDTEVDTDEEADTEVDTDVDTDQDKNEDTDTDVDTNEDKSKDTDGSSAKTGDGFNIWLYVLMFIVSASGLVFGVYYIRKRKTV